MGERKENNKTYAKHSNRKWQSWENMGEFNSCVPVEGPTVFNSY